MAVPSNELPQETDERLLNRAREGNEKSFLLLFERHRDAVFRLAYRLTDAAAAEDITQECFLSLLTAPVRFDPSQGSLRTYLYAAVRNLSRKHYWLRHADIDLDDLIDEPGIFVEPAATRLMLEQETSALVQQAVIALPMAQREVFILFQFEELSLEEIAGILNLEIGTVKSRLYRARERLRKSLAPHLERRKHHDSIR
jgi:RNA polymerase sigma-70 factor (ECF subfamily)